MPDSPKKKPRAASTTGRTTPKKDQEAPETPQEGFDAIEALVRSTGAPATLLGASGAPTPASAWRSPRKSAFLVNLPSGNQALVRRTFDLFDRLKDGTIPNPLRSIVLKQIDEKPTDNIKMADLGEEAMSQMLVIMNETVVKVMVEPRVQIPPDDASFSWEPDEGFISIDDLDLRDRIFLFNLAQGGTADLASFRQQAENVLAPMEPEQDVSGEAEPTSRAG